MSDKILSKLGKVAVYLIIFYMLIPIIVLYFAAFNSAKWFAFPPKEGYSLVHFINALNSTEYRNAVRTSLTLAASAVGVGLFVGVPAAFAIDRYQFKGKNFMQGVFLSPLLLPTIIWAIGLVSFYAQFKASGTFLGLALAHGVLVTPYTIRLVLSSLAYINQNIENAAKSLGATPVRTFFEITVPMISPGIMISALFGFTISFTDLVIATFIAGSRLITFPARVYYEQRTEGLDMLAVAVSAMVMTVIVILALVGEKTIKWSKYI